MGDCIVHFGMHKTGSTSIQLSLAKNLRDEGFQYINFGTPNASGWIASAFLKDPSKYPYHRKRGFGNSQIQDRKKHVLKLLEQMLSSAAKKQSIISGEHISVLAEPELAELRSYISNYADSVYAVGYIRPPLGYMESAFQQAVKDGARRLDLSLLYPHYKNLLEKFSGVYGDDRVRYWLFSPATFPNGCVVQDFCHKLDLTFGPEDVIRVNEGLSLPAVSLLFAYRKHGPGYGHGPAALRENNLLVQRLSQLNGPKLRFHSSMVAPIIEANREDIAWMEARLGASLLENLTENDECSIRSEEDLLSFSDNALHWLAEQLGEDYVRRQHTVMTPQEVATWMHELRLKLAHKDSRRPPLPTQAVNTGEDEMNIKELVAKAKEAAPDSLDQIPDAKASALLREAFKQIAAELQSVDDGVVRVGGFGQFRVMQVEREKEGTKETIKRIVFRPAEPKERV